MDGGGGEHQMTAMKFLPTLILILFLAQAARGQSDNRAGNTVILNETGVKNLRIETVVAEEGEFEETFFALGHIEAIPASVAAVSSRVPGRIVQLGVAPGDVVKAGQDVAQIESRQAGNPPPTITLKAPINGLVTNIEARRGDPLEPDEALLEITDLAEVYAIARVPEHLAGKMSPGATAHIKVAALPNEKFDGKLLRFGTSADEASGTIDAIFQLRNPGDLLRAGMRAEFSIVLSRRSGVVSVPRAALQGDSANRFLYVKDFDLPNAFVKTPVVVGQMNDQSVEILSGLLPADEVVTRGAYSLAFAGGGNISLKEALDAAHGHEHNPDGSEITGKPTAVAGDEKHDHEKDGSPFWKITSAVLFVALVAALVRGNRRRSE